MKETVFLVVVALILGFLLGRIRRPGHTESDSSSGDGDSASYSNGYYQAINDIRATAKILTRRGDVVTVDKVLTTLLGEGGTPSFESARVARVETVSGPVHVSSQADRQSNTMPNVTLVAGALLILASAGLFIAWIDNPVVTSLILSVMVVVFYALAVKFTALRQYIPAGLTFLGLSLALVPVAMSPLPGLTVVSQWIVSSILITAMLVYISAIRTIVWIPYLTTLSFFSLVMSIARGLTDDIFWSFVAVIVTTMALYLVRLKRPIYVADSFDAPAIISTAWVPGVATLVSLMSVNSIGIEKLHIIMALAVAYYLMVWLTSARYVHELAAKGIGLVLLSSITYEHIMPVDSIYGALSFTAIGFFMVASSLIGWSRAKANRHIIATEVAWLITGLAVLGYAYLLSVLMSPNYLFATVIALVAAAMSLLTIQVTRHAWFGLHTALALAVSIASASQWVKATIPGYADLAYMAAALLFVALSMLAMRLFYRLKDTPSYISAGVVVFFAVMSGVYFDLAAINPYPAVNVIIALLLYLIGFKHQKAPLYVVANLFIFSAAVQAVDFIFNGEGGGYILAGVLTGMSALSAVAVLQRPVARKWTLASIVLLVLPAYWIAAYAVNAPGSYDILRYLAITVLFFGIAAAYLLSIRKGAVNYVNLSKELMMYGIVFALIQLIVLFDVRDVLHLTVYAHMAAVALVYVSLFVYGGSKTQGHVLIRQLLAATFVSLTMAAYAYGGSMTAQVMFLLEHALLLVIAMYVNVKWLVYWAAVFLVSAAVYILEAPAALVVFLVGVGLIVLAIRIFSNSGKAEDN